MTAMGTTSAEQAIVAEAKALWGPNPTCWRCGEVIHGPVDAGHIVDKYYGGTYTPDNLLPEHPSCNRKAGGTLGAQITNSRPRRAPRRRGRIRPSRVW